MKTNNDTGAREPRQYLNELNETSEALQSQALPGPRTAAPAPRTDGQPGVPVVAFEQYQILSASYSKLESTAQRLISAAQSELTEVRLRFGILQESHEELQQKFETSQTELNEMVSKFRTEETSHITAIGELTTRATTAETDVKGKETELEALRKQVEELTQKVADQEKTITDLTSEKEELEKKVNQEGSEKLGLNKQDTTPNDNKGTTEGGDPTPKTEQLTAEEAARRAAAAAGGEVNQTVKLQGVANEFRKRRDEVNALGGSRRMTEFQEWKRQNQVDLDQALAAGY